jgi:hypothetical protein
MCRCPDGSYANMIGDQIVCNPSNQPLRQQLPGYPQRSQVGEHCSDGGICGPGSSCSRMPGHCVPDGMVDCGGYYCEPGLRCSSDRRSTYCLGEGEIDCGSYHCSAGATCGSNHTCLQRGYVDCGGGKSCPSGRVCVNGGAECLTREQVAARAAAEKRRQEEQARQAQIEAAAKQQSKLMADQDWTPASPTQQPQATQPREEARQPLFREEETRREETQPREQGHDDQQESDDRSRKEALLQFNVPFGDLM